MQQRLNEDKHARQSAGESIYVKDFFLGEAYAECNK